MIILEFTRLFIAGRQFSYQAGGNNQFPSRLKLANTMAYRVS